MTGPFNPRVRIKTDYLAALTVTLGPVVYFLPAVINDRVLCPHDGLIQNVPLRVAAANILLAGNLPLWNPYYFSGIPLLASSQAGVLFPLNWYYLPFSPAVATNLMVISTYMLAALGAYLYSRRTGASIAGAVVTSIVWQCCGFLVGQLSHINIVQTAAMLPWVLWAIEGYARSGSRARGALLALLVALQAFVGHQQTFAYSLMLVTAYAIVMALTNVAVSPGAHHPKRAVRLETPGQPARGAVHPCGHYLWSLAYTAAGVLLAAVQILPTFELLRNSERSEATYAFLTSFSMPRRFLSAFFAPYIMGGGDGRLFRAPYLGEPFYTEFIGYAGLLALMLAIVAVLVKPDTRTKFWTCTALVCALLAFGAYAPLHLYWLVYYVPVLNLFRVPARHLMEVDLAIAVLAGRGITVLAGAHGDKRVLRRVAIAVSLGVLLTCLIVTWLRPEKFLLAKAAPVSLLRAPELFLPVLFAGLSAWALWVFARRRRGSTALLLAILAVDLVIWGHSSGWYTSSPSAEEEFWSVPETVQVLRRAAPQDSAAYRILTAPHTFDPATPPIPPSISRSTDWVLWTQPDVYMMHGIHNAAGYDGFGLERYNRLAGQMKVWGELTDPETTLRGDSREIDLLNVRYLISMRRQSDKDQADYVSSSGNNFPPATERYDGFLFAENDLGLPSIGAGKRLRFAVKPLLANRVALVSNLAWSDNVLDQTMIGRLRVIAKDGRVFEFPLRAGVDTAEWSYDRPGIRARIKHKLPSVATSYTVNDARGNYEAHSYVTSFTLPEKITLTGGEIELEAGTRWPDLLLTVLRLSLADADQDKSYPLRREWMRIDSTTVLEGTPPAGEPKSDRWKLLTQTSYVDIYENSRYLPRAWLASESMVLDEGATLEVVRTGKLDGSAWDPVRTALVEATPSAAVVAPAQDARAEITNYEPNRVNLKTYSGGTSILVLSENFYPGWRAYVDGRATDTLRVNYNLRGVELGPGAHQVEFVYRPKSVIIGFFVSLLTLAALLFRGLRGRQTRK
ncbi:MAG: YfhO family protein [Acidobacteriota bacterium]|nr:YfhO family protein [Acidobacteriota bacterium]